MTGKFCSLNGELIPADSAAIRVDDIDFTYGYGVYETLKVRKGILYFPALHARRLLYSASLIGLAHNFEPERIEAWIGGLVEANGSADANVKMLFIGGESAGQARLYIMTLNPLFPSRKLYRDGAKAIIYAGERVYPQAKTLNMLISTMAFRQAQAEGAYDAILRDSRGFLTEGTRTNLFYTDGRKIFTPPADTVLEGVTKLTLARAVAEAGLELCERALPENELDRWAGYFLTSTSTKVMPLSRIGAADFEIPGITGQIMKIYDAWLERWAAGGTAGGVTDGEAAVRK
ncbi:MAG: aminotransferase class IV [Spirochaetales bacterium]|jgi:branched-subunit amino acid aminotransferase/4-amino-4-deoxychorismate lyase|nr:aminotransferase class IV [Spirochaetales bacterium]